MDFGRDNARENVPDVVTLESSSTDSDPDLLPADALTEDQGQRRQERIREAGARHEEIRAQMRQRAEAFLQDSTFFAAANEEPSPERADTGLLDFKKKVGQGAL